MHLLLTTDNPELKSVYESHSSYHEGDSGFDLFTVDDINIEAGKLSHIIDLQISCEAFRSKNEKESGNA